MRGNEGRWSRGSEKNEGVRRYERRGNIGSQEKLGED